MKKKKPEWYSVQNINITTNLNTDLCVVEVFCYQLLESCCMLSCALVQLHTRTGLVTRCIADTLTHKHVGSLQVLFFLDGVTTAAFRTTITKYFEEREKFNCDQKWQCRGWWGWHGPGSGQQCRCGVWWPLNYTNRYIVVIYYPLLSPSLKQI